MFFRLYNFDINTGGNRVDFRSLLSKKNYAKTSEEIKPLENPHETVLKKVEKVLFINTFF